MNSSSRVRIPTSKQEIHRVCHSVTVPLISHENVQTASVPRTINCAWQWRTAQCLHLCLPSKIPRSKSFQESRLLDCSRKFSGKTDAFTEARRYASCISPGWRAPMERAIRQDRCDLYSSTSWFRYSYRMYLIFSISPNSQGKVDFAWMSFSARSPSLSQNRIGGRLLNWTHCN